VAEIKTVIAELPTYGYRRVHAILKRQALAAGLTPPNHKRVYRVMKVHGVLLDRHAGGVERRHDGRIAVDERNRRWCSDGFEIGCDNGERVRVAFALDCCDREAMSFLATTSGVSGEDVRDLMLAAVEHRFGIQWIGRNCASPQPIVATVSQHPGRKRCERAGGNLKQKARSQWLPARALIARSSAAISRRRSIACAV
jgi:transposase InsO family protein